MIGLDVIRRLDIREANSVTIAVTRDLLAANKRKRRPLLSETKNIRGNQKQIG